jgi:hypothetical protein
VKRLGIALGVLALSAALAVGFFALRRSQVERTRVSIVSGPEATLDAGTAVKDEPPLDLGPSGTQKERQTRALELMTGGVEARRLPVVAAEPSEKFDYSLVEHLAPKGPPQAPCQCPPGDPLCDCP